LTLTPGRTLTGDTVESVLGTARIETLVETTGDRDLRRHAVQTFVHEVAVRLHPSGRP